VIATRSNQASAARRFIFSFVAALAVHAVLIYFLWTAFGQSASIVAQPARSGAVSHGDIAQAIAESPIFAFGRVGADTPVDDDFAPSAWQTPRTAIGVAVFSASDWRATPDATWQIPEYVRRHPHLSRRTP
jgi:hypothetical protein